jgi:hypothetical protein
MVPLVHCPCHFLSPASSFSVPIASSRTRPSSASHGTCYGLLHLASSPPTPTINAYHQRLPYETPAQINNVDGCHLRPCGSASISPRSTLQISAQASQAFGVPVAPRAWLRHTRAAKVNPGHGFGLASFPPAQSPPHGPAQSSQSWDGSLDPLTDDAHPHAWDCLCAPSSTRSNCLSRAFALALCLAKLPQPSAAAGF